MKGNIRLDCTLGQELKSAAACNPTLTNVTNSALRILSDMESYAIDYVQVQTLYSLLEALDERYHTTLLRGIHGASGCAICSELSRYGRGVVEKLNHLNGAKKV